MSTISKNILPIPDSVVVGSGSYTIPADRYGFLSASCAITGMGRTQDGVNSGTNLNYQLTAQDLSNASNSNSNHQYIKEGDSITVSSNLPNRSQAGGGFSGSYYVSTNSLSGYYRVLLNGTVFCIAFASARSSFTIANQLASAHVNFDGQVGWSVSLYRIPKNNLPTGQAEGE